MPGSEPLSVLHTVIDAMNRGENTAGLTNMTDDVVIVDDVSPFRRAGRDEAEQWFRRLALARKRLDATLKLESADVRVENDRAYIVGPGVLLAKLEGADLDVNGTITATLRESEGSWLVDGLIWSSTR